MLLGSRRSTYFMNERRDRIERRYLWKPKVWFTVTPRQQLFGDAESGVLAVVNRLARKQHIHIQPWLVVGDYRTSSRLHIHGILASDKDIDMVLFKKLLRDSIVTGRNGDGNQVAAYDSAKGGIEYMYSRHIEVPTMLACPRCGKCKKSKRRSLHHACYFARGKERDIDRSEYISL
mgnify:CR=1 FL=1